MTGPGVRPVDVVLGGLRGEQAAEAERRLREDPVFRVQVRRLQQAAGAVRDAAALSAVPKPPALDLGAAMAARPAWDAVPAGRATVPTGDEDIDARRRPGRLAALRGRLRTPLAVRPATAALAGGALALGSLAGGLVIAGGGQDAGTGEARVAADGPAVPLRGIAGFGAGARVSVHLPARAGAEGDLVADGLAPSPSGHYYELWLMTDGRHLASLGSFRVGTDGHAHVRFALAADPRAYRYLDVSVEPDDGDPAHSSSSILRSGPLT